MGNKLCKECKKEKSFLSFQGTKRKNGKTYYFSPCKECLSKRMKLKYDSLYEFKGKIQRYYNLSWEEYIKLYNSQEGKCKICQKFLKMGGDGNNRNLVAHLDHSHETGKIRGFLCRSCNMALGLFKDSKELLKNAHDYLNET